MEADASSLDQNLCSNNSSVCSLNDKSSNSDGCSQFQDSSLVSYDNSLGNLFNSQFLNSDSESGKSNSCGLSNLLQNCDVSMGHSLLNDDLMFSSSE